MRTSLSEIKQIDDHLFNRATAEERLLFEAMLILDPELPNRVLWQKKAHTLVQQYGRKKLKAEIESVHHELFTKSAYKSFRQSVLSLFH